MAVDLHREVEVSRSLKPTQGAHLPDVIQHSVVKLLPEQSPAGSCGGRTPIPLDVVLGAIAAICRHWILLVCRQLSRRLDWSRLAGRQRSTECGGGLGCIHPIQLTAMPEGTNNKLSGLPQFSIYYGDHKKTINDKNLLLLRLLPACCVC